MKLFKNNYVEGCKKNWEVYEKISKLMSKTGYDRIGIQCREKIKKLKVDYCKVKDKNKQTGKTEKIQNSIML